jgi:hypothetical protein
MSSVHVIARLEPPAANHESWSDQLVIDFCIFPRHLMPSMVLYPAIGCSSCVFQPCTRLQVT